VAATLAVAVELHE
jgi:hypothetical protein